MGNEKKMIFVIFVIFPTVGNNENKKNIYKEKKKKFSAENVGWATGQLYCKGWNYCIVNKDLYCSLKRKRNRIARLVLYCNRGRI